jgi:predicted HicB family RNase H-like nuclease
LRKPNEPAALRLKRAERKKSMKDTYINIKFNSELKSQAQAQAKKEGRTLSNWIECLIRREIEKASGK